MEYDNTYLEGLYIAEKDGRTRVLEIAGKPFLGGTADYLNKILLAMQGVGYEIVSVSVNMPSGFLLPTTFVAYK